MFTFPVRHSIVTRVQPSRSDPPEKAKEDQHLWEEYLKEKALREYGNESSNIILEGACEDDWSQIPIFIS